jgi:hypothetical protein
VVQCPDTDVGQLCTFVYGFYGISSCYPHYKVLR